MYTKHFAYCMDRQQLMNVLGEVVNSVFDCEVGDVVDLCFPDVNVHLVVTDESREEDEEGYFYD